MPQIYKKIQWRHQSGDEKAFGGCERPLSVIYCDSREGSYDVHYTEQGYEMLGKLVSDFLEKEIILWNHVEKHPNLLLSRHQPRWAESSEGRLRTEYK